MIHRCASCGDGVWTDGYSTMSWKERAADLEAENDKYEELLKIKMTDQQKTAEPCRGDKPAAYWARYNDGSGKIYEDKDRAEAYAERAFTKCVVIPVYTKALTADNAKRGE